MRLNLEHKLLVGAVPVHNGEVLVIQRSNQSSYLPGRWAFVAGKKEQGEGIMNALRRELEEEVGIKEIRKIKYFGKESWVWFEEGIFHIQLLFHMQTLDKNVTFNSEVSDFKWVKMNNRFLSKNFDEFNYSILTKLKQSLNL